MTTELEGKKGLVPSLILMAVSGALDLRLPPSPPPAQPLLLSLLLSSLGSSLLVPSALSTGWNSS